ncbi:MAG TPA: efflux RND transporter periplasmic adaptor subunit [Pyrinomonadaceae bacterium]
MKFVTILRSTQNILRRQKLLTSLAICVVALAVIAIVVISRSGKQAQAAPTPVEVEVVQVKQDNVPVYREWVATTDGMVNAEIKSQVTGYLLRQDYKEGTLVRKGQLLFEIDPRPFQAALDQAKGQLAQFEGQFQQAQSQVTQAEAQVTQANSNVSQAQAQLSAAESNQVKAQLDVNKYAPLAAQKAVTQQEYDNAIQANKTAGAQVEAAKAGVESARSQLRVANAQVGTAKAAVATAKGQVENATAAVKTAELNLSFTRIVSPIDGIAGIATAQVGNLISTNGNNSSPLTTVSTVDPIKVYFTLNEQEYLAFTKRNLIDAQPGASVANLQLDLILADGSTYPEKGSFLFADRQVDPKTGAIRLAGVFPNPGNILRPGQFGRVRAVTSTKDNALMVPQRAVSELQGSYQVAVVGDDNKVSIRPVKVGEKVDKFWIINDGLKAGERVVVEGTQKVRPGVAVNPRLVSF